MGNLLKSSNKSKKNSSQQSSNSETSAQKKNSDVNSIKLKTNLSDTNKNKSKNHRNIYFKNSLNSFINQSNKENSAKSSKNSTRKESEEMSVILQATAKQTASVLFRKILNYILNILEMFQREILPNSYLKQALKRISPKNSKILLKKDKIQRHSFMVKKEKKLSQVMVKLLNI